MSSDSASPLQVAFTPEFKRNLRQLVKKYRRIKSDLRRRPRAKRKRR